LSILNFQFSIKDGGILLKKLITLLLILACLPMSACAKEEKQSAVGFYLDTVVTLTAYEPNRLTYDVTSAKGGVVVFSEIYYPGWTATIDGDPVELGRVDYVLRALTVGPGRHQVELAFFPKSIDTTETIAYVSLGLLLLLIVLAVVLSVRRRSKCDA
jgi:uncharacterized membrane protein YfhO